MDRKHTYMTIEEKKEFQALVKRYGLEELTARFRQEPKPEPRIHIRKQGRRHTRQRAS